MIDNFSRVLTTKSFQTPYKSQAIGSFICESGEKLEDVTLAYETFGRRNSDNSNVTVVAHALTGSTHVCCSDSNPMPGWWDNLIGAGKAVDTDRYFVICINTIGGCNGSTGPSSINPDTNASFGMRFPDLTVRDMVHANQQLLNQLGIDSIFAIIGGSMGGMQALEWAAMYPNVVENIIVLAAPGQTMPQSIAYRKAQRLAIMQDPDWQAGDYYGRSVPVSGMKLARMIGFISYRSEKEFASRFGRSTGKGNPFKIKNGYAIEDYLDHQGQKLVERFDANTYIYLSKAMDTHDLGFGHESYAAGVQRISAGACIIGFSSDLLFPAYQQAELAQVLSQSNDKVEHHEIETPFGHDGFLVEADKIGKIVISFLKKVDKCADRRASS